MTEMYQNILYWIYSTFNYANYKVFAYPLLNNFFILFTSTKTLIVIFAFSMLFISAINQVKNFSPTAEDKPLPLKFKLIINLLNLFKYVIWCLFVYWIIVNAMLYYISEYKNNFDTIYDLTPAIFLFIETTFISLFVWTGTDKIWIWKSYIDRKIITPLNKISIDFQEKNDGRERYNPDGIKRKTKDYDVKKYIKDGLMFHGLNENNKPVYTDFWESLDGHYTIMGGTGFGKGVLTRIYLYQTIKADVTNIIIDPKPDTYMYDACCSFAKEHNKNIHIIDLDSKTPQVSLFKDLDKESFIKIVLASLEFSPQKQSNAKIHAVRGESSIYDIADIIYKENITPNELRLMLQEYPDLLNDDSLKLFFRLLERAQVFNTKKGLRLKSLIESKDIIYIRCKDSKTLESARDITQILIMTIYEHINNRNNRNATQCVMVIDEFKFVMNTVIMNNLATVREQKCSLIFNFQDTSNFITSPNYSLRNEKYATELLSNSHFIAVHNASDNNIIHMIQERCGEKQFDKFIEEDKSNAGGGRETSNERRWSKHTEYKLTKKEISTGQKRTAILLSSLLNGSDEFTRIHTDYLNTDSYDFHITSKAEMHIPKKIENKKTDTQTNTEQKKEPKKTDEIKNKPEDNTNNFIDI
jgi:hypothetical protein